MNDIKFTISISHDGFRLDRAIVYNSTIERSRSSIKEAIKNKFVKINGVIIDKPKHIVQINDVIEVKLHSLEPPYIKPESIPIEIIYEDEFFMVVNKPCGMVVHPGAGNHSGTLVNALMGAGKSLAENDDASRPGIVHRLDKDTSGLLLVAKTQAVHRLLSDALARREVQKEYDALVSGRIEFLEGQVDAAITRDRRHRTQMCVSTQPDARASFTQYKVTDRYKFSSLVRVYPKTGRTHQIRVHFKHIGHPVLGDKVYGHKKNYMRMALHAARLEFEHPMEKKKVFFEAELPKDFRQMIKDESERA